MDQQSMLQDMNQSRRPKPPQENQPHQPPPPPQKCPRCDSLNTKFCYYNNYSLSQPRYFCKGCRRYWTHGGTLRNVPVGGGCRKGKRARASPPQPVSSPSAAAITSLQQVMPPLITNFDQTQRDARGNLGIQSQSPSSSSSPYFPAGGGGFLSSLAAMNMRSLSPMMMNQPQIHHHHQIGIGGQGFNSNTNTIPILAAQNQHNSFNQMLVNDQRETSNMEPMFIHHQQQQQQPNRGLVPPWALSNQHHQNHQNLQIGNPSFWNSNIRNTGSSNSTSSSMMSSLGPNQWLNLPGCGGGNGSGPDSSSSMIDKKP